ncbi:MAG TPA: leucine--tRNA ligase, partial [Phycisphaerales bacterium]|nr:leucine--tRNA ligase [Phycisphaerales bacterium]
HPMGWDAFGLPAEQYAIQTGTHPATTTEKNINTFRRQLQMLGFAYDWSREVNTTDEHYYKWTQWIFLQLFNSWFDPTQQKARPIGELIAMLENEEAYVDASGDLKLAEAQGLAGLEGDPVGAIKWHELDAAQQREFIDFNRLAFLEEVPVNWCPALGTVLANEEVTNEGKSERGNHPVFKRPLKQWMLRITSYAERLADDLEGVDWPEPIKIMQRNWIGRSEGALVDFEIAGSDESLRVFTTRPDTLFGATYMVLAPEHPLVDVISTVDHKAAVAEYQTAAEGRSDMDRMAEGKEKTGVFTGAYAINPVNGKKTPIWIADYVMMGYGTGAIMAVPAHDARDFAFANTFNLPIIPVVLPDIDWLDEQAKASGLNVDESAEGSESLVEKYLQNPGIFGDCFHGKGTAINSGNDEITLDEKPTDEAKQLITQWLADKGLGQPKVQYKLRDWLFSRQRYWGEPFPILHGEDGSIHAVPEGDLPVEHPHMEDFKPTASNDPNAAPQPPLGRAGEDWLKVAMDGQTYTRETNSMPQWAGSCWYFLRFLDPKNTEAFASSEAEQYWMKSKKKSGGYHNGGVDLYVGGAEHAVLHLLYARFWHKVLFDLGYVSTPEPFGKLFNQGYIQAYAYTDERGIYVEASKVEEKQGKFFYEGKEVKREFGKMGKSLKNAVTPDEICEEYGCDTMRVYEMYMGPLDQSKIWNTRDIAGPFRFLQRVWRNYVDEYTNEFLVTDEQAPEAIRKLLHKTIKRVTDDMERMSYNTAIAALIELNNELVKQSGKLSREVAESFVLLLSPIAPHMAEELWQRLGHEESLARAAWPKYDEALLVENEIELPVQVNGKVRGKVTVPADADDDTMGELAQAEEKVAAFLEGKTVRKVIVIKGRMVNIVAN